MSASGAIPEHPYAFLVALEELTPRQRAVLLLRDVFDYGVAETADVLEMSEANVKTSLHRARRAMSAYDRNPTRPGRELAAKTRNALENLLAAISSSDAVACRSLLAEQVVLLSDGGDEFVAAKVPIVGRERVLKFEMGLMRVSGGSAVMVSTSPCAITSGTPAMSIAAPDQTGCAAGGDGNAGLPWAWRWCSARRALKARAMSGRLVGPGVFVDQLSQDRIGGNFTDMRVGAPCLTAGDVEYPVGRRQQHHRQIAGILRVPDQAAGLVAVQLRHGDIQKDDIGLEAPQQGKPLITVFRRLHFTTHLLQGMRHHHADGLGIVDDGHADATDVLGLVVIRHKVSRLCDSA